MIILYYNSRLLINCTLLNQKLTIFHKIYLLQQITLNFNLRPNNFSKDFFHILSFLLIISYVEPSILRSDGKSRNWVFCHIHQRRESTREVIYLLIGILIGFEMHSSSQLYQQLCLLLTRCLASCPQKFEDIDSLMQVNNLSMSIQVLLSKPETSRTYQLP